MISSRVPEYSIMIPYHDELYEILWFGGENIIVLDRHGTAIMVLDLPDDVSHMEKGDVSEFIRKSAESIVAMQGVSHEA